MKDWPCKRLEPAAVEGCLEQFHLCTTVTAAGTGNDEDQRCSLLLGRDRISILHCRYAENRGGIQESEQSYVVAMVLQIAKLRDLRSATVKF